MDRPGTLKDTTVRVVRHLTPLGITNNKSVLSGRLAHSSQTAHFLPITAYRVTVTGCAEVSSSELKAS